MSKRNIRYVINDFVNAYGENFIYLDRMLIDDQIEYEKAKGWTKKGEFIRKYQE